MICECCLVIFFFSSRRRHTRYWRDWSSDVLFRSLRVDDLDRRLENRIAATRIRIDPQQQRVGREPAEVDHAIHDRLRRIGDFDTRFGGFHQIRQIGNLLGWREDQIDWLIDVILNWIERDHTGLSDPRADMTADMETASTLRRNVEGSIQRQYLSQARDL